MLLSGASLKLGPIRGATFILQKNWPLTSAERAERILRDLTINFSRMTGDKFATKAFLKDLQFVELNNLHGAIEMSLKQHSSGSKASTDSVSVFGHLKKDSKQYLILKNHSFFSCQLEDKHGELFGLKTIESPRPPLGWHLIDLSKVGPVSFTSLIFSPAIPHGQVAMTARNLHSKDAIVHHRMADLVLRSSTPYLCPSYRVALT